MNRLTVIGWNGINIGILILLVWRQLKGGAGNWVQSLQSSLCAGIRPYVAWALFLTFAIPILF